MLTKISQKILPDLSELKIIVIDTDIDQGSDTEKLFWRQLYLPNNTRNAGRTTTDTQELLDSLTRIDITPSPPQGDKLLPRINQVNKRETIINDDDDITNYKWSRNYK